MVLDVRLETKAGTGHTPTIDKRRKDMDMSTQHNSLRRQILDLLAAPFRQRSRGLLDQRALSDHFRRDIGLLDGHPPYGSIR